jgi:hypothetical protein
MVLVQNRYEDQWNRIEDPDLSPRRYNQLIFDEGFQNIRQRKNSLFNKCCWENWVYACKKTPKNKKLKLHPWLLPCTSINSKWTKDLKL